MASPPGLDIVIVSYRTRDVLRDCLRSIRAHAPHLPVRTFVVDNASGDGTVEMVRAGFREVELIVAEKNLGFARANNIAIRRGSGPYVLALNPDTRLTPGALDCLLDVMGARPEIGILGCRLELEDGTFDHAAKRSFPTVVGALGHFTGIGRRPDAPPSLAQYRAPLVEAGPVDAVNGAFMLMRRAALDQVGLFDERYWMYMEDLDLCYRFAEAGWKTWYEPAHTVIHKKGGAATRLRNVRLNYAFHYGMFRFYRTHYARRSRRLTNAAVYAGIAAKFVASAVRSMLRRALVAPRPLTVYRPGRSRTPSESRSPAA